MKYVHIINDESVTIIDSTNGEQVKYHIGDERYDIAIEMIASDEPEKAFCLDVVHIVESFFLDNDDSIYVEVEDGIGLITIKGYNQDLPLHDSIVRRMMKMKKQGFDSEPMMNFLKNLYQNQSSDAVNELYQFIEKCELPITSDGHFIAYKIVNEDYTDCHTSSIDNSIGQVPTMPRHLVDTDRHNTCSVGLHFCSRYYANQFGRRGSRCMLVKINPADVVSIPSDYSFAKGRTWKYEVVGEVVDDWKEKIENKDYTDMAVDMSIDVSLPTTNFNDGELSTTVNETDDNVKDGYYFDTKMNRYRKIQGGRVVKASEATYSL